MNRAERRKKGIRQPPPKMKHMTENSFNESVNLAYRKGFQEGVDKSSALSVYYMLGISLLALHDNFGDIRFKEVDGKSREERFFNHCVAIFDEYNDGVDTLERLFEDVKRITGFDMEERVRVSG